MLCWFQKISIPKLTNFTKQFWQTEQPKFYKAVSADCYKKERNKQRPCQRAINYGTVWRKDPANWGLESEEGGDSPRNQQTSPIAEPSEEDGDSPSNQQTILLLLNQVRKMVTLPATSRLFSYCWTKWGRWWLSQQPADYSTVAEPSEEDGDSPSNQQTILLLLNQVRKMVTLPATSRLFYCCWTKWGRWWLSQQPADYSTVAEPSEEDGDSPSNQQTILLLLNQVRKMLTLPAINRLFYCCWTHHTHC